MKTKLLLFFAICLTAFSVNAQINSVAIVGTAVGGWPTGAAGEIDTHQLTQIDADNWSIEGLTIASGPCKLRANNAWGGAGFEWAGAFPTAVGTSSGDILVPIAGVYTVTLNTATGVYLFSSGAPIPVVKLFGTAVSAAEGLTMSPIDAENYTLTNTTLLDGLAQFDVDGAIAGGSDFPMGIIVDNTLSIPVTAGEYSSITINIASGEYNFIAAPIYPSIAIVGSGAGGWPNDPQVDANVLATTDGETYKATVTLTDGAIKFRSNNNWSDPNWGGVTFPTGPDAGNPGGDIMSVAGTYDVTFTRSTGAYVFSVATIALVGPGAGGWPSDPQVDANVMTTTDNGTNYIANLTLTDGFIKFRANNAWTLNWGSSEFPAGTAVLNGPDMAATAGVYNVTLNRVTGAFTFTDGLANTNFATSNFRVSPNPTNTNWNFVSSNETITAIQVIDMLGKVVATSTSSTVDATALNTGIYFAKVSTGSATETIKLVKN